MEERTYLKERDAALTAVREAALLCRRVQAQLAGGTLQKEDRSPVTVADFGSQALVCRALQQAFPHDPVIGEEDAAVLRQPEHAALMDQVARHVQAFQPEAGQDLVCSWIDRGGTQAYSDRFWTLDPIDGTKGFLRGEQYAIALALIVDGRVTVAALACPNLAAPFGGAEEKGAVYAAIRGGGTFCFPLEGRQAPVQVRVSALEDAAQARFCESVEAEHSSHGDAAAVARQLGIETRPVRLDSQAKYAVVARGGADIYLRLPTRPGYVEKIWDHAAGMLLVSEAGGKVTDLQGRPLDFRHGRALEANRGIVATNGKLHRAVLAALEAVDVA